MRGDGQRPPHLAGALDAIAPAQAHSRRPCGRSAVVRGSWPAGGPSHHPGSPPPREHWVDRPSRTARMGLDLPELPWQSRGELLPF